MRSQRHPIKEFLYVDVERVRSLLAQLDRGVVENLVERTERASDIEASAQVLGIGGTGSHTRSTSREESKSLQDLAFVLFEEAASKQGVLRDATTAGRQVEGWRTGQVQEATHPGELIRMTCDLQIVDPRFFQARLSRIETFGDALLGLVDPTAAPINQPRSKAERRRGDPAGLARRQLWGDVDPGQFKSLSQLLSQLLADSISVRLMPCGAEHAQFAYVGALIGRSDYIQEEREVLFGRYGGLLQGWTTVLQVAAVPSRETVTEVQFDDLSVSDGGVINRAAIESMALRLNSMLEGIGFSEGPRWPSISATILGIYRAVPTV